MEEVKRILYVVVIIGLFAFVMDFYWRKPNNDERTEFFKTAQCFQKGEILVYLSSVSEESEPEVIKILESSGWEEVEGFQCVENRKEKTRFLFEQNGGNEFYFLFPEKHLFFSGETPAEAREALAEHLKK